MIWEHTVTYYFLSLICFSCDGSYSVETLIKDDVGTGTTLNGSMLTQVNYL